MRPAFLKYPFLLSVLLAFSGLAYSQEFRYDFEWTSGDVTPMSGVLVITTTLQPDRSTYQMDFSVSWMDANGSVITDPDQMPFLYLSRYDIEINPKGLECTNFEQNRKFELTFSSSGRLMFSVRQGFAGDCMVIFGFQYALSREKIAKGELERIVTRPDNRIRTQFKVPDQNTPEDDKITADNRRNAVQDRNVPGLSDQAHQFQRLQIRWMDFVSRKASENLEKEIADLTNKPLSQVSPAKINELKGIATLFNIDLEDFKTDIKQFESNLDQTGISKDTASNYRAKADGLLNRLGAVQTAYNQYRLQLTSLLPDDIPALPDSRKDSLLKGILDKYRPDFIRHVDSMAGYDHRLTSILQSFQALNLKRKPGRAQALIIDSLLSKLTLIRSEADSLSKSHAALLSSYREDVITLNLIPELENLQTNFARSELSMNQTNALIEPLIRTIKEQEQVVPWFRSNWAISGGLILILALVLFVTIRNMARERRLLSGEIRMADSGYDALHPAKATGPGGFPDTLPDAYYSSDFRETLPESVVGKVHYNFSSIKAVYQMVHGAFMEKKAGDFGGYLFGNKYKLTGNGSAQYEMIVEKACASRFMRAEIQNDIEARADLVDELDEIIKLNKKYLLIGWFTASSDSSLEMPEGLMKIHRNFFKEKWQFGILINPGSEELQSALFLRRKSGYVEPYPDPASFLRWEELYQYSINPPVTGTSIASELLRNESDYASLGLNLTWSDSMLGAVGFHKQVIADIQQAAAFVSIPDESYQRLGYLYGACQTSEDPDRKLSQYTVYVDRFLEIANETTPREIPGYTLLGWWGQGKSEIFTYLPSAISYHEQFFREPYQMCCLVNVVTGELRIFTRKKDLTMNNNVIETEEFNLSLLV